MSSCDEPGGDSDNDKKWKQRWKILLEYITSFISILKVLQKLLAENQP